MSPSYLDLGSFAEEEERIGSRVEFTEMIGEGGFGAVYVANGERGARCAIKRIQLDEKVGIEYPLEPVIMMSLVHPALQPGYKVMITSSHLNILSPLAECDGRGFLSKHAVQSHDFRRYAHGLLQAVACLHAEKIVHADIKLENLLFYRNIDGSYDVRLTDFSIAAHVLTDAPIKHGASTRDYRPLECWAGLGWHKPLDLWCLGATLFELLHGRLPVPRQVHQGEVWKGETPEAKRVRARYVPAHLEWGRLNRQVVPEIRNECEHWSHVTLPQGWGRTPVDQFLLAMLQVDASRRSTANDLLNHDYFRGLPRGVYDIRRAQQIPELRPDQRRQLIEHLHDWSKDERIVNWALEIYRRCLDLKGVRRDVILRGSYRLAEKIVKRRVTVTLEGDLDAERQIAEHTQFRLL